MSSQPDTRPRPAPLEARAGTGVSKQRPDSRLLTGTASNGTDEVSKGKVLLLDDDKFLVDMYSMKFTKAGYTVKACLSADDALQALRDGFHPDAIVFDVIMPGHDGFYFLETLERERINGNAAIVALTNESDDLQKAHAMEKGADRLIVKAMMIPSEVVSAVEEEIAKKHRA